MLVEVEKLLKEGERELSNGVVTGLSARFRCCISGMLVDVNVRLRNPEGRESEKGDVDVDVDAGVDLLEDAVSTGSGGPSLRKSARSERPPWVDLAVAERASNLRGVTG